MKQANFLIKLAALASSVLLVSGFVCYRAGAFTWLTATKAANVESGPSDATPQTSVTETRTGSFMVMVGSKSDGGLSGGIPFPYYDPDAQPPATHSTVPPPPESTSQVVPAFFGGSKSPVFQMFVPPVPPSEIEAAQQLLKQARKAFENGKLDEARALARRARYKIISWEDDNPYILLDEIEKAEATPSLTNSPVARPSAPSPKP